MQPGPTLHLIPVHLLVFIPIEAHFGYYKNFSILISRAGATSAVGPVLTGPLFSGKKNGPVHVCELSLKLDGRVYYQVSR